MLSGPGGGGMGGGGGGRGRGGGIVPRPPGSAGKDREDRMAARQKLQQAVGQMQIFSGGAAKSERALVAGTDGSVEQVEERIAQAVKTFGPAPGGKKMMDAEKLAAEEAISTGLYGVWRNASSCHDFCGRIGPASRCFCGHEYGDHAWDKGRRAMRPSCSLCSCSGFRYIPRRPEEVGEWWLPRRRGFDVRVWRAKCKCGHSHEDHDPNRLSCRCCGCSTFQSAWLCVSCDGKWEDHESLWESEEERRLQGLAVGQAFMPLASTPQIQGMVLGEGAMVPAGDQPRSWSLPHRPRPERSVRLMQERCPHYGGNSAGKAITGGAVGSLEDAFPPARRSPAPGSLEDAFPPARRSPAPGSLEDAFPPARRNPVAGSLEDVFPPRRGDGGGCGRGRSPRAAPGAITGVEDTFPTRTPSSRGSSAGGVSSGRGPRPRPRQT